MIACSAIKLLTQKHVTSQCEQTLVRNISIYKNKHVQLDIFLFTRALGVQNKRNKKNHREQTRTIPEGKTASTVHRVGLSLPQEILNCTDVLQNFKWLYSCN